MKILISFCNQINRLVNDNLVLLDTDKREKIYLLDYLSNRSITGITQDQKYFYVCYQDSVDGLIILNKVTLQPVLIKALPKVKDAHSIIVKKNKLYVISTAHDKVVEYEINWQDKSINYECDFYSTDQAYNKKDMNHLNSISVLNDDIYLSGLGLKNEASWSTTTSGFIRNISKNYDLFTTLQHPHSITLDGGDIFYCESIKSAVKKNTQTIINMKKGYTRGLAKSGDILVVGSSSGRTRSKSSNQINRKTDSPIMHKICQVSIFKEINGKYEMLDYFDFIDKYQEIYDILIIS